MVNFIIQSVQGLRFLPLNDKNLYHKCRVLEIFNVSLLILLDLTKAVNLFAKLTRNKSEIIAVTFSKFYLFIYKVRAMSIHPTVYAEMAGFKLFFCS